MTRNEPNPVQISPGTHALFAGDNRIGRLFVPGEAGILVESWFWRNGSVFPHNGFRMEYDDGGTSPTANQFDYPIGRLRSPGGTCPECAPSTERVWSIQDSVGLLGALAMNVNTGQLVWYGISERMEGDSSDGWFFDLESAGSLHFQCPTGQLPEMDCMLVQNRLS